MCQELACPLALHSPLGLQFVLYNHSIYLSFDFHQDRPVHRLIWIIWGGMGLFSFISFHNIYCSLTHLEVFNTDKPRKIDCSSKPQILLSCCEAAAGGKRLYFTGMAKCHNACCLLPACPCHLSIGWDLWFVSLPLGQPLLLQLLGRAGCLPGAASRVLTGERLRRQRSCVK